MSQPSHESQTVIAFHKTFERPNLSENRQLVMYASNGQTTQRLVEKEALEALAQLTPGSSVRFTAVNAVDELLVELAERGVEIKYAGWHSTGIPKNLEPAEIAKQYANLPDGMFRVFHGRRDLMNLRMLLNLRNTIMQAQGDAMRRLQQIGRNAGILNKAELSAVPAFNLTLDSIKEISAKTEKGLALDTVITKEAKNIPECVLFNEVADFKGSYITGATIVAYSGGIDRFDRVSSFWHYLGQHVVDGVAPKRRKGLPVDWSPACRTAVYMMGDSIIKNRNNKWRAFFDDARAAELAVHLEKHPGCKNPEGHSTSRARRLMCKEILAQFFVAAKGEIWKP